MDEHAHDETGEQQRRDHADLRSTGRATVDPVVHCNDVDGLVRSLREGQPDVVDWQPENFMIVLRGYHRGEVDDYVSRLRAARAAGQPDPPRPSFSIALRGYERRQVEAWLQIRTS